MDVDIAFNTVNSPDTWVKEKVICPHCNEQLEISVPREVRASEWHCNHCGEQLVLRVKQGEISLR